MPIEYGVIKQIAYVVDDLERAIARWVDVLRVGPFFCIDGRVEDVRYRGQPAVGDVELAIANSGGVQIELIAQRDAAPSVFREIRHGVHHLAILARDFEEESRRFERLGHPVAWAITIPGICRVNYHDTVAPFGHFIELWENTGAIRGLLELTETSARDWDGREPVRRIPR